MFKSLFALIAFSSLLMSCDVRKKDKIAAVQNKETELPKDPTTVEIIDSVYDFGSVGEGAVVEYNYRFKNIGDKPLVVSEVHASCGCTVPEKPEAPIKPGEIGFIKVKFNSEGRPGEVRKSVTVSSNANPGFPTLQLKGHVDGKEKDS